MPVRGGTRRKSFQVLYTSLMTRKVRRIVDVCITNGLLLYVKVMKMETVIKEQVIK
jgi:hypothetical protein